MAFRASTSGAGSSRHGRRQTRSSSGHSRGGAAITGRSSDSSLYVSDGEPDADASAPGASRSIPRPNNGHLRARHHRDSNAENGAPADNPLIQADDGGEEDAATAAATTAANSGIATTTSRVTRVARREGIPPLDVRPRAPALTTSQQGERIIALQNQIRYTFAVQPNVLRRHLRNNNWNVIEAADAFWEEEEAARNRATLPDAYYELPLARTVETSRLHARTALRRRLSADDVDTNSLPLSNTAIFSLLQRNHWVLDHAEKDYRSRHGNLDDITDAYSSLRTPRPSRMEQDARLAAFVSLTSTNSIFAARSHLARQQWDYARAVDAWRRNHGLPEDCAPKRTNAKGFVHESEPNDGLRYNNANHPPYSYSQWRDTVNILDDDSATDASLSSDAASDSSLSEVEDESDTLDKSTYDDSQHRGYLIEFDRRPAMVNCPDPSKLRVEMIQKGKYKMVFFKGRVEKFGNSTASTRRFRWHDEDRKEDGEVNSNVVHQPSMPSRLLYLEEDFLWMQHAEHLEEEVGNGRINPTDRHSYPVEVTRERKQKWTDALNQKFAGQTKVDGIHMSDEPRPTRLATSIDTARHRMQSIIDDFGLNVVKRHGPQQGRRVQYSFDKRIKVVRFESGSESDNDVLGWNFGLDEIGDDCSSESYEEAEAGKRKAKGKVKGELSGSKRPR